MPKYRIHNGPVV